MHKDQNFAYTYVSFYVLEVILWSFNATRSFSSHTAIFHFNWKLKIRKKQRTNIQQKTVHVTGRRVRLFRTGGGKNDWQEILSSAFMG